MRFGWPLGVQEKKLHCMSDRRRQWRCGSFKSAFLEHARGDAMAMAQLVRDLRTEADWLVSQGAKRAEAAAMAEQS